MDPPLTLQRSRLTLLTNFVTCVISSTLARCLRHRTVMKKSFIKEGFIKLDGQDKPQIFFSNTPKDYLNIFKNYGSNQRLHYQIRFHPLTQNHL